VYDGLDYCPGTPKGKPVDARGCTEAGKSASIFEGKKKLVLEGKTIEIPQHVAQGGHVGMQTFNQSLATLYFAKQISLQTALGISSLPEELQDMINRGAGLSTPQAGRQPMRPAGR